MVTPRLIPTGCSLQIPYGLPETWTFDDFMGLPGFSERTKSLEVKARGMYQRFKERDKRSLVTCRLVQWRFGGGSSDNIWSLVEDFHDAYWGWRGYDVVGQNLHLADIPEDAATVFIALTAQSKNSISPAESEILEILFASISRSGRTPPIDFDVVSESSEFIDNGGRDYALGVAVDYTRRFMDVWHRLTGGTGVPYLTTPSKGSIHVDLAMPPEVRSVYLYPASQLLKKIAIEEVFKETGMVPFASECGNDKSERPAVIVDDGIWERGVENRGGVWRPPLGCKRKKSGGASIPKLYIPDLNRPLETLASKNAYFEMVDGEPVPLVPEPVPVSVDALIRALEAGAHNEIHTESTEA